MTGQSAAYVVHALPGRVRVRIPDRKGDQPFFTHVAHRLSEIPEVTGVAANPLTGSVLIHFSGEMEALAVNAMTLLDEVRLELSPPPMVPLMQRVRGELVGVDAGLRRLTGGEMDARAMMFLALVSFSAVQLMRGNILAPAATMLWYSGELARRWRPGSVSEESGAR